MRQILASVLLDLGDGKLGSHKGDRRLAILQAKAGHILETLAPIRAKPRTLALELKAELIRQLRDELLANHDRVVRLERMLRDQLLPATQQTITTIQGIGTIIAAMILGETAGIIRFRSPAAFAVYNGTAPARHSTGGRDRHQARRDCNYRLKRTFWLSARSAVLYDPLAKTYLEQFKRRGLNYAECLKRVARRMSDIVYALLKSGRSYEPAIIRREQTAPWRVPHQARRLSSEGWSLQPCCGMHNHENEKGWQSPTLHPT